MNPQYLLEEIIRAAPVRGFWKDLKLVYLGCNALFAKDAGFSDPKDIIGKDDYQDDKGYWNQIEGYIKDHSEAEFSHSICQDCAKKYYPDMDLYGDEQT